MDKRKLLITIFTACLACLLIFLGAVLFLHQRNSGSELSSIEVPSRETGTFADELSADLSAYTGQVVVGYAVDLDYLNRALNTVKGYSAPNTAVYIFYAGVNRDDLYYVSYTVYDDATGEFTDYDTDMVESAKDSGLSYVLESRSNLINTRK